MRDSILRVAQGHLCRGYDWTNHHEAGGSAGEEAADKADEQASRKAADMAGGTKKHGELQVEEPSVSAANSSESRELEQLRDQEKERREPTLL